MKFTVEIRIRHENQGFSYSKGEPHIHPGKYPENEPYNSVWSLVGPEILEAFDSMSSTDWEKVDRIIIEKVR